MNKSQVGLLAGGGAVCAGSLGTYLWLRPKKKRVEAEKPRNVKPEFSSLATVQRMALLKQFPIYPQIWYDVKIPVTSFELADNIAKQWVKLFFANTNWMVPGFFTEEFLYFQGAMQVVSSTIAERLGVEDLGWAGGTVFGNGNNLAASFKGMYGTAAASALQAEGCVSNSNMSCTPYLSAEEAHQFWVGLFNAAGILDVKRDFEEHFWGDLADEASSVVRNLPRSTGEAVKAVTQWGAEALGSAGRAFFNGLFGGMGSVIFPIAVIGVVGTGSFIAYRKLAGPRQLRGARRSRQLQLR